MEAKLRQKYKLHFNITESFCFFLIKMLWQGAIFGIKVVPLSPDKQNS